LSRDEGNEEGVDAAVLVVRLLVGALLVVAGALKAGHSAELASSIANFRLLPAPIVGPLAVALPYFELLLGGYLIAGLFTRVAAAVATAQFVLYAAAIGSAVLRHIPANCGCFGPGDAATADWPHVAFDLALAGASGFIAYGAPGALAFDRKLRNAA
jgi:putative oxidoreductase